MTEFGIRTPELLTEAVRTKENEIEESLHEAALAERFFHDEYFRRTLFENPGTGMDELGRLQRTFLEEKRGKNMGQRFNMALKYLGKIHVVELGKTTDPGASGEVDGLKHEYHDLLDWMILPDQRYVERELTRQESGRTVSMRDPKLPEAIGKLKIMTRDRPLINAVIDHKGQKIDIGIAKRMVFSMPIETVHALNGKTDEKDFNFNNDDSLEQIEMMLQHGTGGVVPIRTAYYLATDKR